MTTYQHGQQPDGAPVTWRHVTDTAGPIKISEGSYAITYAWHPKDADAIARAFHLAKLAEDASKIGEKAGDMHDSSCFVEPCNHLEKSFADWLRRYREAVR